MSRVILILGCHRSGTSLVARSLKCLGVELSERAEWSGPDNPTGFYENRDVLAFNEIVSDLIGWRWDQLEPEEIVHYSSAYVWNSSAGAVMKNLMREEFAKYPVFGIKEPRLCRLLPLWKHLFHELDCEVSVVHVVRHPMAVARSLQTRNGFSLEKGLALWTEYNEMAHTKADPTWPSLTVSYENFVCLPMLQVARIGRALDLKVDIGLTRSFAAHFVRGDLWHESPAEDDVLPMKAELLWELASKEALR